MTIYKNSISIKAWAEEDRPREKLLLRGRQNVSDAELIAILLGSGNRNETAVSLAQRILKTNSNNLNRLSRLSVSDLKKFNGIGQAKAITLIAALELGRRRQLSEILNRHKILSSNDAYQLIGPLIGDLNHEEFWVVFLNRANRVIDKKRISSGGVSGTVVDAKIIFKLALEKLASSVILYHNHPSGNLNPSSNDLELTRKIKSGAKLLDISVLDHIIIAETGYFSFADEAVL